MDNLLRAYEATQKWSSIYRAVREYSVPEQTSRDRTKGHIALDAKMGYLYFIYLNMISLLLVYMCVYQSHCRS